MIRILEDILSDRMISALGYTFLHSLWIGAVLSLVLFIILVLMRKSDPRKRYYAGVFILAAFLVANIFVFTVYASRVDSLHDEINLGANAYSITRIPLQNADFYTEENIFKEALGYFEQNLPMLILFWFSGIMLLGLKFLGGLIYSQRLKSFGTRPLGGKILQSAQRISSQFGITQKLRILESRIVKVPLVIGYFKPVIIIPASVLLQIPQDQIEAILSHELAHIKRRDNLINLLQSIVEIIFFYHPATWWISGLIRKEREEVCDDMALNICPNRLKYAKALMNLEVTQQERGAFAVAFTGQRNTLVNRIKRLIMKKEGRTNYFAGLLASLSILVALALMSTRADAFGPSEKQVINSGTVDYTLSDVKTHGLLPQPDTLHKDQEETNETLVIHTTHQGRNVVLHKENGEISKLEIDGEKIDPVHYPDYKDMIAAIEDDMRASHEKRMVMREQRQEQREKMLQERREMEKEMQEEVRAYHIEKKVVLDSLRKNQLEKAEHMRAEIMEQNTIRKEEIREMIEAQIEELKKIKNDTNLLKEYYGIGRGMPHPSSPYLVVPDNEDVFEYRFFSEPEMPELPEIPELPEMEEESKWIYLDGDKKAEVYVDVEKELQRPAWKESFMDDREENVFVFRSPEKDLAGFNESITRQRLRNELKKDDLIDLFNRKEIYLTKKELIVDGEKQPRKLMKKYRDMYEALSGKEIGKDEIIEIQ